MKIDKNSFGNSCFVALYGSQNYQLDMAESDRDYMILMKPDWKDFIEGRATKFGEQKNEYDGHNTLIDFRKWFSQLKKGTYNALELLWSVDKYATNGYDFVFNEIVANRDLITKSARNGTLKSIRGVLYQLSGGKTSITPKNLAYQVMFGNWLKILANGGEFKDCFEVAPSTVERIRNVKRGLVIPTWDELYGWKLIEEKIPENFHFNLEEFLMCYEEAILFE